MVSRGRRRQAYRVGDSDPDEPDADVIDGEEQTLELREEQLVAHKDLRELGEIQVRTEIDQLPGRLEVDAYREEVVIEHEPVGQIVSEREQPSEDGDVLVVPIYEEQLVVVKRLVLRERMRIRRVGTTERRLFQDTVYRERLVVEDSQGTGLVRQMYATADPAGTREPDAERDDDQAEDQGGFLQQLVRKALE